MNAYELADKAEQLKTGEYGYVDGWMDEAAHMLRQQADRIAELEHMNKNWQLSETMAYNRIAELERLVSDVIYEKSSGVYDRPQIKELSDEEISLVIWESYQSIGNATLTDLCKAILKKASEK